MPIYTFAVPYFILVFHVYFSICGVLKTPSLYNQDDPLIELDPTIFNSTVYGNNQTWIIEFYSSWCGHCQRFAPIWKEFARDVENWEKVIKVGVVNCVDEQNLDICRQYNVGGFPTIKLFWHNVLPTDEGTNIEGRDVNLLENLTISFLESNWNKGVPQQWPQLSDIKSLNFNEIIKPKQPHSVESVFVFIEGPDSLTGKKVILDFSFQDNIVMKRVLTSDKIINELHSLNPNQSFPALVKLTQNGKDELYLSFEENNESYIRDRVFKRLFGRPRIELHKYPYYENKTSTFIPVPEAVYLIDLENALHYSLFQEVGVAKDIQNEKMVALKSFISILNKYFPGSKPVKDFLTRLHNWVSDKTFLSGESFSNKMNELTDENVYLPEMRDWVGCKGSRPDYRGYPCSMWVLFHTLTVQANIINNYGQSEHPEEVLTAVKGYIKYFFSCEECVRNFFKMDGDMDSKINTYGEAVLWLWEAHNKVNKRLSGDKTEDPNHPKNQFPEKLCKECQIKNDNSEHPFQDRNAVMKFLNGFYSKEKIVIEDPRSGASRASYLTQILASTVLYIFYFFCCPTGISVV